MPKEKAPELQEMQQYQSIGPELAKMDKILDVSQPVEQPKATPNVQSVLADPNFLGLPDEEKKKVLLKLDPRFSGLPSAEQDKVIMRLRPPEQPPSEPPAEPEEEAGFTDAALQFGKQAALPTAGSYAGGAAGLALGGPPGAIAGEAIGGAAGEIANQALGITEPSLTAIGVAAAAPPLVRGALKAGKAVGQAVIKRLPGAAPALHENAAEAMKATVGKLRAIGDDPDVIDNALKAVNPRISLSPLQGTLTKLEGEASSGFVPALKNKEMSGMIAEFQDAATTGGPQALSDVRAVIRSLNRRIYKESRQGGESLGQLKQLRSGMQKVLDEAAESGVEGANLLRRFNVAWKRSATLGELEEFIEKKAITQLEDGMISINGKKILNHLAKDDDWIAATTGARAALSKAEVAEIKEAANDAARLAGYPPRKGAQFGSGPTTGRGIAGYAAGGELGAAIMAYGPQVLSRAMMTAPGRKIVSKVMRDTGGKLGPQHIQFIAEAITTGVGDRSPQPAPIAPPATTSVRPMELVQ